MLKERLSRDKQDGVSEITSNTSPYIGLEIFCNADGELEYQIHQNQIKNLSI